MLSAIFTAAQSINNIAYNFKMMAEKTSAADGLADSTATDPANEARPSPQASQSQMRRYAELIVYAVIFFGLVAAIFLLNINLATLSRQDAAQIFCATEQQRSWQRAYRDLYQITIAMAAPTPLEAQVKELQASLAKFDAATLLLRNGGTLKADGGDLQIEPVSEPQAKQITDSLYAVWSGSRDVFKRLENMPVAAIDSASVFAASEFAQTHGDALVQQSQEFIVRLGRLSEERITRLQSVQVTALLFGLVIFLAMVGRLSISLRKQDKIISERTVQIEHQRDELSREKERVESLFRDLRETQSQLIQSEKMASLGQMVAGLAHEINTPLNFVATNLGVIDRNVGIIINLLEHYREMKKTLESGNLDELQEKLAAVAEAGERIESLGLVGKTKSRIAESGIGLDRIQELIANLKNFSRLDETAVKLSDLNDGLESSLLIANNIVKYKAEVEKHYHAGLKAECYPAQLNQVFLNLITNAAQAMETHGKLIITTLLDGETAVIKIADTGKGIAPENLKKIFEPFFTTKPVGQGTGLGLSIVFKIIEQHKGTIDVQSEIGKGSEFTIRIPVRMKKTASKALSAVASQG
ncbi:MAG: hypothetical protein IAF08_16915 [Rhizobacter sp.]|nr:hypothetical protein [Chlorobiales bacterium]